MSEWSFRRVSEWPADVLRQEGTRNIFHSAEYLRAWHRHFGGSAEILSVECAMGNERAWVLGVIQDDRLFPLGWNTSHAPRLVFQAREEQIVPPLLRWVRGAAPWVAGVHGSFEADSPVRDPVLARGFWLRERPAMPIVRFGAGWRAYYKSRSDNVHRKVRRLTNKYEREGVRYESFGDESGLSAWLEAFTCLHAARWGAASKYRGGAHRAFLHDVCAEFLRSGALWMRALKRGDAWLATAICFVSGRRLHYVHPAYDPRHEGLSPGSMLLFLILQEARRSGLDEVNLGPGEDGYKGAWATDIERRVDYALAGGGIGTHVRLFWEYRLRPALGRLRRRVIR